MNYNTTCFQGIDYLNNTFFARSGHGRISLDKPNQESGQFSRFDLRYGTGQITGKVRHQRMIEFFREGPRFCDLKRWGMLENEIANGDKEGKQYFNLAKHRYFPIPEGEN